MKMKRLFIVAAAAAMLAGCGETEELAQRQDQQSDAEKGRIDFTVYANRNTRAGQPGEMDMTALQGAGAGFGVFAYYTDNTFYDERSSVADFMYNQPVTWSGQRWTYDPVKYWPNEFGSNAASQGIDYVTFFAYAPFVDFDPVTGAAPAGNDPDQQQWKNITSASRSTDQGDPLVRYIVDTNPQTSVDLLWGVAAEKFQGMAPSATTTPPAVGACFLNLSKQVTADDAIKWRFQHALAKLNVQIVAASDVTTADYNGTSSAIDDSTRIYLRWIEFKGFAMLGALNLHSGTPGEDGPVPNWRSYDGTADLKPTVVRFNDGLLDGDEGIAHNTDPNERVLGALNPDIIESPTTAAGWTAKNPGITAAGYVNLFKGATDANSSIYVIPTNSPVSVTMSYDIETADPKLGKYLSDGKTTGIRIPNVLTQRLDEGLTFKAGKAYTVKIIVGMESVKVEAVELASWGNTDDPAEVDLPETETLDEDPQNETVGTAWGRSER